MPFKVRCRLSGFLGDAERFPCHFEYKVGDEIIYDGEKFIGRICPGLFGMVQNILILYRVGNNYAAHNVILYSGLSKRNPDMKKYDGIGWSPLKQVPDGADLKKVKFISDKQQTEPMKGSVYVCGDVRTSAYFICEPYALADVGDALPYYKREMAILDKIKSDPGLTPDELLKTFSEWEREEIYPPLSPVNTGIYLDELATVGYIKLQDGKVFPA
jgi:hypothetical protein